MAACTFFGHKVCSKMDSKILYETIEGLIHKGVDTFYVGHQGEFDRVVYRCLKQLRLKYPEIEGHPKFVIERRNNCRNRYRWQDCSI